MRIAALVSFAASLFVSTGALAADAVVSPEPEPMEYVRVCDVYGVGFFYIPGTETCLRVSGHIRQDIAGGDLLGSDIDNDGKAETYNTETRATLMVDARSETELGTLRGYVDVNFDYNRDDTGTADDMNIDSTYLMLGGFKIGKDDSLFTTITNSAGDVITDDLINYEPNRTLQINYTYSGPNGFSAMIGLEQGDGENLIIQDYTPDAVAGASLVQGWGSLAGSVAYDSNADEWAAKARLDAKLTQKLVLFTMVGWSSTPDGSYYAVWSGDWAIWGGGTWRFSEKAHLNVQLSYDDSQAFAAVANIKYRPVHGLTVTPEIAYYDSDTGSSSDEDAWGAIVRFERDF